MCIYILKNKVRKVIVLLIECWLERSALRKCQNNLVKKLLCNCHSLTVLRFPRLLRTTMAHFHIQKLGVSSNRTHEDSACYESLKKKHSAAAGLTVSLRGPSYRLIFNIILKRKKKKHKSDIHRSSRSYRGRTVRVRSLGRGGPRREINSLSN